MNRNIIEKLNSESFWRYLSSIWTVLFIFVMVSDFINNGRYNNLFTPLSLIYAAILSIFVSTKEFQRWRHIYKSRQHPGEVFVIIWSLAMFLIFLASWISNSAYKISTEVTATYIMVISVFAITQSSKNLYKKKNR